VPWINNRLQIHDSEEKLIENYYPAMAMNNCCFIKCSSSWINCKTCFPGGKSWALEGSLLLGNGMIFPIAAKRTEKISKTQSNAVTMFHNIPTVQK